MSKERSAVVGGPHGAGVHLLWRLEVPLGGMLGITGAAMVALAFSGSLGNGRLILELILGAAVFVSGAFIVGAGATDRRTARLHLAAGELALAATIVYLGVAMPPFHAGSVGHDTGVAQFVAVISGLVLGATVLALPAPPAATSSSSTGIHWPSIVRDSVILIVGTIVVAIGLAQLANPGLMPPKWNWTSFLGITIPGMLILVFVRGPLKAVRRGGRAARQLGLESLLVVGLSVLVFGSVTNLSLGASGYAVGLKGNGAGLRLWLAAAVFLVVVRGAVKLADPKGFARVGAGVARKLLYVAGAVTLIYGEKSMITGKPPAVVLGGAAPTAATILAFGLLLLIPVRQTAKAMDPGGSLGPVPAPGAGRSRSVPLPAQ